MKKIFLLILIITVCSFLCACTGGTTAAEDVGQNSITVVQENVETTVENPMTEESENSAESAAESENAQVTDEPVVEEDTSATEEVADTTDQEKFEVQNEFAEEELEYEISDEELQSVREGFQQWLLEQKNPPKSDANEMDVEDDVFSPIPVEVTRSDEEVMAFIDNFLDNYHNSESFRSLEGEGITYLNQCMDVLRNDPYSEEDIAGYIEKYKRGSYDDEMFQFMLECWIEFGGSFGEGCNIYIQ